MGYYLTVISGPDEGRAHFIETDQVVIGRSPSAQFVLSDESVAWEHAQVRVEDGRWMLSNLAAAGTRHKGKKVAAPVRLAPEDEVELSASCRLQFVEEAEGSAKASPMVLAVIGLLLLALLGVGTAYAVTAFSKPGSRPVTATHWRSAYRVLDGAVDEWVTAGRVPPRMRELLRNAWRLEQVGDFAGSMRAYEELNSILLTLVEPSITGDSLTFAESAGESQKAMQVMMGYDTSARATDYEWATDSAHADALVWFTRKKAALTRKLADDAGQLGKKKKKKGS